MKLFLPILLLASLVQAQQKPPVPNPSTANKEPKVKIVEYQLNDIQRLQLENLQKDWKIALQQFYITSEAIKKQNNWPDSVTCNIESLRCSGPEVKKEEEKKK